MSNNLCRTLLFSVFCAIFTIKTASPLECYQCSGTDPSQPFLCNEFLEDGDEDLVPQSCDNVYGASHCIKHIGRFEGSAIKCYQCNSAEDIDCSDLLINDEGNLLKAEECSDVFEAQYCIKSTAMQRGIGTKRYCSSLDLGNYCNYVQHIGDTQKYRSCVFSCNTDGCNSSGTVTPTALVILAATVTSIFFMLNKLRS